MSEFPENNVKIDKGTLLTLEYYLDKDLYNISMSGLKEAMQKKAIPYDPLWTSKMWVNWVGLRKVGHLFTFYSWGIDPPTQISKMTNKIIFTINGYQIKTLGNIKRRIKEKFDIDSETLFIRNYSAPMIQFGGYVPPDEIKQKIIKILKEEVEFGLLVDEF